MTVKASAEQSEIKPKVYNSIQISHMGNKILSTWTSSASFPGVLAGSCIGSEMSRAQTDNHMKCYCHLVCYILSPNHGFIFKLFSLIKQNDFMWQELITFFLHIQVVEHVIDS